MSTSHKHVIRLLSDGSIHQDLTVDASYQGERDKQNTLVQEGGVEFRTEANKVWFLKFSEFQFVVNATPRTLGTVTPRQLRKAA